ncbi:MAG: hypothetical protein V7L29_08620 [Nostoc sp.]
MSTIDTSFLRVSKEAIANGRQVRTLLNPLIVCLTDGVDGFQLAFYDFEPDLDFFGKRVLPLLKQAGLRGEF